MSYSARLLITRAWYLSKIVSRRAQTVSGDQIFDGLNLLNELLDWKSVDTALIPFWTYDTSITAIPGQEAYFIPSCVAIESITFNIGSVRYPMDFTTRSRYFGTSRVDNISSLPFNWNFLRQNGGGTLYLYFLPGGEYPLKFMGKFALQDVTLDEDLLTVYDRSYIAYLRYALAQYMCSDYGIIFDEESKSTLKSIVNQLMYVSPPDLSVTKTSILTQSAGINFGDVNIGMGFRPS